MFPRDSTVAWMFEGGMKPISSFSQIRKESLDFIFIPCPCHTENPSSATSSADGHHPTNFPRKQTSPDFDICHSFASTQFILVILQGKDGLFGFDWRRAASQHRPKWRRSVTNPYRQLAAPISPSMMLTMVKQTEIANISVSTATVATIVPSTWLLSRTGFFPLS